MVHSIQLTLTIDTRERQVATAFSGWFTFGDTPGQVPPSWKQGMIVLLVLFPVVMLELLYLNPLLQSLNPAVATFIGNLLSVVATAFLLIPLALRAFKWWLLPRPNDSAGVEVAGTALIIGLYALSIAVFAWLILVSPSRAQRAATSAGSGKRNYESSFRERWFIAEILTMSG